MTEERRFGWLVGAVLSALGALLLLWRHRTIPGSVLLGVGVLLLLLALAHPVWLATPNRLWRRFGAAVGRFNTWLFMSLMFFLVLTPVALFFRLIRRDALRRRRAPDPSGTMWVDYPARVADAAHFEKMF